MLLVCTCLAVRAGSRMAVDATKLGVVRRINVAIGADRRCTQRWVRKPEEGMVENGARPSRGHVGRVAGNAGCRIQSSHMIGHARSIRLCIRIIALMAAVAVGGRIAGRVVAAAVAVRASIHHRPDRAGNRRARRQHVRALQREACRRVVKLSIRPKNRVVARRTHGSRKPRGNVVRYAPAERGRALPGGLVASIAVRVRRGEVVVVPGMAVRASDDFPGGRQLVRTGERPAGNRVIEDHVGPQRGVVAGRAIRCRKRSSRRRMRGVIGLLPGGEVALRVSAIVRLNGKRGVVSLMALIAAGHLSCGRNLMRVLEREAGRRVVEG